MWGPRQTYITRACTQNKLMLVKCIRLAFVLFTFILNNIDICIIYINIQIMFAIFFSLYFVFLIERTFY